MAILCVKVNLQIIEINITNLRESLFCGNLYIIKDMRVAFCSILAA